MPTLTEKLESWLPWASALSLGLLLVSVALSPLIIARLPEDYFVQRPTRPPSGSSRRVLYLLSMSLRNVIGLLLVLLGVLMLALPGQGILTILAGLFVMRFPAKRRLLGRALSGARVRHSVNYLRRRMGKPDLVFPESHADPEKPDSSRSNDPKGRG